MKAILTIAAGPILVLSLPLALASAPKQRPFPFQQSWKLSGRGHGTMFPVKRLPNGIIFMTARHVVKGIGKRLTAYHPNYGTVRDGVRVLKIHPTLDLATIFVPTIDQRIIPVLPGPAPKLGDKCIVVAYPGVGRRRITGGYVCGPDTFSAQIIGGSSGGPVFNKAGQLIGVVRAVDMRRVSFGLSIEIQWMGYLTRVSRATMAEMLQVE